MNNQAADLEVIEVILTKLLGESNKETREELRRFISKWNIRVAVVGALQEKSDEVENEI
jgi:hypothetical protein